MKPFALAFILSSSGMLVANFSTTSHAMNSGVHDAKKTIVEFLTEVYDTKNDALQIAHRFIRFEDSPSSPSEFTAANRYEIAAAHITLLRKGEAIGLASPPVSKEELAMLQVMPYATLIGKADIKLVDFGPATSQRQDLYVVLKDKVAWKYFLVKKGKIYSFDYMMKGEGGPAYLFGY